MKKASLVGAFFVSAIWLTAAQAFCPTPSGLTPAVVQRVVDGDTLRLKDGRSVRLIGLNAPELARQGRPAEPFAAAARARLQALVKQGAGRVGVRLGAETRDRYGRTLAYVYGADGSNLAARLLAEGLAYQIAIAPNVALASCQRAAEDSARQARLGLWRQASVLKAQQIRASGFAVLGGRVSKVQRNRGGVWIELQGSVVLHIAPKLLANFDASLLDRLQGREIEARGWVVDRARKAPVKPGQARWMLPLTDPTMLRMF